MLRKWNCAFEYNKELSLSLVLMRSDLGSGEVLATVVKGPPCENGVLGGVVLALILVSKLGTEFNLVLQLFAHQVQLEQNKWSRFVPEIACVCKWFVQFASCNSLPGFGENLKLESGLSLLKSLIRCGGTGTSTIGFRISGAGPRVP